MQHALPHLSPYLEQQTNAGVAGQESCPSVCFPLKKQLYELLEGLKMEEYTRKHLNESVYPFVYVPQNPLHFCIKEESEEERNRKCS